MEKKLTHARTCVYNCNYHIIWTVKYRRKVITPDIEARIKEIMYRTAKNCEFTIHELEVGGQGHVHLFVSAHPKLSVSYIVRALKAATGQAILKDFPAVKKQLWGGHLWGPSYYVETIGSTNENAILRYIQEQDKEPVDGRKHKKHKVVRSPE